MKAIDVAYNSLVQAGVKYIVALPDSLLAPLCMRVKEGEAIKYIQAPHESSCVSIASGLTLCGERVLVVMENSGLRSACETIARFNLSHSLFACYLISHRGSFGERNWWGQAHHETMRPLLEMFRFRWAYVESIADFSGLLQRAYATLDAGQSSVSLIAQPGFLEELAT